MKDKDDPFEAAMSALLQPLARAMISRGMPIGAATESLKRAMLVEAVRAEGDTASDSRVSLLTGLHRKDVKRLRSLDPSAPARKSLNASALVVSRWSTDPDYLSDEGAPKTLDRQGTEDIRGFDDLVRATKIDLPPATVLSALVDQGAVAELDDGLFRLEADALVPRPATAELTAAYRATLSAHLDAATHNLLAPEGTPRNFDRVMRYSHLSDASVTSLEEAARQGALSLLTELNALARDMQDNDRETGTGRFAFGSYILPDPAGDPDQDDET